MSMGSEARDDMLIAEMMLEQLHEHNIANGLWTSQDNKTLRIGDMTTSHIENTLKWMDRVGFRYEDEYRPLFGHELMLRGD